MSLRLLARLDSIRISGATLESDIELIKCCLLVHGDPHFACYSIQRCVACTTSPLSSQNYGNPRTSLSIKDAEASRTAQK